jgi:hypothetical protein
LDECGCGVEEMYQNIMKKRKYGIAENIKAVSKK